MAGLTVPTAKSNSDRIHDACEQWWSSYSNDCSGFAKAVANEVGVSLTGMANSIVDQIQSPPWLPAADGVEAEDKAAQGFLVIAGLKAPGNGHVVIVVPGTLNSGAYPHAYWGRLGGTGAKNRTINYAWVAGDRDQVIYAYTLIRP